MFEHIAICLQVVSHHVVLPVIICTRVITKVIITIARGIIATEAHILQDLAAAIQEVEDIIHLILSLQRQCVSDGLKVCEFALVEVGHIGEDDCELSEKVDEIEGDSDYGCQF